MTDSALQAFRAAPRQEVQLGTATVRYRRFGRGPAVVMVHGWPLNGATYRDLIARVQDDMTCYVPDLPGAGDSPWDAQMSSVFDGGGALIAGFVEALGLSRVTLVGHDSGGLIARVAAARLGERLLALQLTNTEVPNHYSLLVRAYAKLASLPMAEALFERLLRSARYRRSGFGFGGCFYDRDLIDGDFSAACIEPMRANMAASLRLLRAVDFDYVERLSALHARIEAPVACVWGARDPFFPLDNARAMHRQFPNPRAFEVVERARLLVHEEAPDVVARQLRELVSEVSPRIAATQLAAARS